MQNVKEGGNGISCNLADFGLVEKGLVEHGGSSLLFALGVTAALAITALGFLAGGGTRHIKAHLDELVATGTRLLAAGAGASQVSTGAWVVLVGRGELDGNLVATCQVGVGYLGVRDLEGGLVLNVEDQFGLAELGLAPVPPAQRVLFGLEVYAVPVFEDLAEPLKVL